MVLFENKWIRVEYSKKKKKDSNKKSDFGTTAATVGSKIKESKVPYVVKDLSSGIP